MKLHRNLVDAVASTLHNIMAENASAAQAVEQLLASNKNWGSRDRHFIAENIYEIIRNYRLLAFYAQSENPYHLIAARLKLQEVTIPEWEVFSNFHFKESNELLERKILLSIPDWLDEFGANELGDEKWYQEMKAMHTPAKTCLRINTLKSTLGSAIKLLLDENLEFEIVENSIVLSNKKNIQNTTAYKWGYIEVQDLNSQKIVPLLEVKPNETVIDACAGAGGKTLQIAAEMQNSGRIVALDVAEKKLQELRRRALRAGVKIATTQIVNNSIIHRLKGKAHKLLLDVPCSGSGVFRRKPDSKFKLNAAYHPMLQPGGTLLYATCSIFPCENEKQIHRFLNEFGDQFQLKKEVLFSPAQTGFDGFYAAVLEKY
jgi:16S rRNA (cytosine967-C5)-methyltransferase